MKEDARKRQLTAKFEELRAAIRRLCPDPKASREATQRLNLSELAVLDAFERKRTDYEGCYKAPGL